MPSLAIGVVAAAALIALVAIISLLQLITVYEFQRGLLYRKGRFVGLLAPGRYLLWGPGAHVRHMDVRRRTVTVPGQEVLTSEGAPLKVSLAAAYLVVDPARAANEIANYEEALYLALQIALRRAVGAVTLESLIETRSDLSAAMREAAVPALEDLGLKLVSLDLKDIMFTGEMRRLFTQVLRARKEGQAALEWARGETAALRSLLNVARTLEDHPSLLQLRALQRVGDSSGNTIVLGLHPNDVLPLPGHGTRAPAAEEPASE